MLISIFEEEKNEGTYAYKHIAFLSFRQWIWLGFFSLDKCCICVSLSGYRELGFCRGV
jgi:hypothetical protein